MDNPLRAGPNYRLIHVSKKPSEGKSGLLSSSTAATRTISSNISWKWEIAIHDISRSWLLKFAFHDMRSWTWGANIDIKPNGLGFDV